MNQELGLRVLSQVMNWDNERARREFGWLRLMARLKYDGYRDFQAGMRFIESLATWLQQFTQSERDTAYAFVRQALVFIGPGEMERLVEQFYPRTVRDRIVSTLAAQLGIHPYRILADAQTESKRLLRQTLFMGLSDGARIDMIRHANSEALSNEQFVQSTQLDIEKWKDLLDNLRKDLNDSDARFRLVFLVDDFAGTGTSLLRFDTEKRKWKGKLFRFRDSVDLAEKALTDDGLFEEGWELCIHHYVASSAAVSAIKHRLEAAASTFSEGWASWMHPSFGTVLPPDFPIDAPGSRNAAFIQLTQSYYDPIIRTKHTDVGGVPHLGLGYGGCALPLVLQHNTPNNAVALLWAETSGGVRDGVRVPAMRPLFRRRQRHA